MRTPRLSDERGIALALAVFALVVVGALVAGIFLSGQLEQRSGTNTVYAAQAFEAAEAGLAREMAQWDGDNYNSMLVGSTKGGRFVQTQVGASATNTYTTSVTRLNDNLFRIRSDGEQSAGGSVMASRSLGLLARLVTADLSVKSAVTSKGGVTVGGSSVINGKDNPPAGWSGCAPGTDLPAIRTSDSVHVNGNKVTIDGTKPDSLIQGDKTVVDSIFKNPFKELAANADLTLGTESWNGMAPATLTVKVGGVDTKLCDKSVTLNWGEPWTAPSNTPVTQCQGYFPVIYRDGNLKVQNGRGQGILLVTGDLEVRGNFEFAGIVIALGEVQSNGTGNKITGAVFANNSTFGDLTGFSGNPTVNFSSCAVNRVLKAAADVAPVANRSWAQRYN